MIYSPKAQAEVSESHIHEVCRSACFQGFSLVTMVSLGIGGDFPCL